MTITAAPVATLSRAIESRALAALSGSKRLSSPTTRAPLAHQLVGQGNLRDLALLGRAEDPIGSAMATSVLELDAIALLNQRVHARVVRDVRRLLEAA